MRAGQPPARERLRRWNAANRLLTTKVIIGLNAIVFVATAAAGGATAVGRGGDLQARLALFGPAIAAGEWWRLVTSGFVHYGALHILFNMLILYRFGEMLEPALGRVRMAALYLAALLTGSFGALVVQPRAFTAGASGAVFGLVGAAAMGYRQRGVGIWQSGVGGLLAINLLLTFAVPGISIGGHIGGLVGGGAVGAVMLAPRPAGSSTLLRDLAVASAVAIAAVIASFSVAAA